MGTEKKILDLLLAARPRAHPAKPDRTDHTTPRGWGSRAAQRRQGSEEPSEGNALGVAPARGPRCGQESQVRKRSPGVKGDFVALGVRGVLQPA